MTAADVSSDAAAGDGGIVIRPLRAADIPAATDLWQRCGLPYSPAGRDTPAALAAQIETADGLFLAAFAGERLIGTALGTIDGRQKGWINRVSVDPDYQRQGLAIALIRHTEAMFAERGCLISSALIEAHNAPSLALFQKLGFDRTDVVYLRKPTRPGA